jgi:hypothetical protein
VKISEISDNCNVKARLAKIKNDEFLYVKCSFKNAGVLHNPREKHGISLIVAELLCAKINGLSRTETKEKLSELGVRNFEIRPVEDDFILSFRVLKSSAAETFRFLSSIFSNPEFSQNDLEFAKEKYPIVVDPHTSHPDALLLDKLINMLYADHNYGLNNSGSVDAVSGITENDVHDFIKSNFVGDRTEIFFAGDIYETDIENLIEILCSKLPPKSSSPAIPIKKEGLSSSGLSKEKEIVLRGENMGDIVGVMCGIRIDNPNEKELATLYAAAETLFNEKTGDFNVGLRTRNIARKCNFRLLKRELSCVLCWWLYTDKKDSENYRKYLAEKISAYSSKPILREFEEIKNYLVASSRLGFADISDLDQKIRYKSLPFSKITSQMLADMIGKLFDGSRLRIVRIEAPETKTPGKNRSFRRASGLFRKKDPTEKEHGGPSICRPKKSNRMRRVFSPLRRG